jgi:hypothetical protein
VLSSIGKVLVANFAPAKANSRYTIKHSRPAINRSARAYAPETRTQSAIKALQTQTQCSAIKLQIIDTHSIMRRYLVVRRPIYMLLVANSLAFVCRSKGKSLICSVGDDPFIPSMREFHVRPSNRPVSALVGSGALVRVEWPHSSSARCR